MTIYDLKPKFQSILRPLTRALVRIGVTANQVTVAACALSVMAGLVVAIYFQQPAMFLLLPLVLFARMALNAIDGMLAREHGQKSNLGAILNELTDVISDAALYLPFALLPEVKPVLVIAAVFLAMLTEMTGVLGITIGASRRYDGPMGKSDRAFWIGFVSLLLGLGLRISDYLDVFWGILIVLLVITIVNRAHRALKEATPRV